MQVKIQHVANVYVRAMIFEHIGDSTRGHKHLYDHTSYVASGRARITVRGEPAEFGPHSLVFVGKDEVHDIEALEEGTVVLCIHALRDNEGYVLAEGAIPLNWGFLSLSGPEDLHVRPEK